ncbi:hypothetical protein AS850_13970 [Frondihabitans sp. 762G35]|uniref:YcnI family copper-binding membrane protein n=1 Tax=Frondihabitans sp. 762G35 TaxID=1446794 RepID=UPI000D201352|nr:YcnI family protein [Frondihabitans sp. 762G35]ARC58187.1 hypothetical protein AS850_13970 [Frondihabitans sp. 762G35]
MKKSTIVRAAATLPVAVGLALAAPLAASAHVHVVPESAPAGDYATLQFKAPTESATASTVKLEVDFPTDHPFTSVSYQPLVGWTAEVVTSTLPKPVTTSDGTITKGVTKVVWTASEGAGIKPGAFQLFTVSAGAVPDVDKVELPVIQTYSDGSVVKWNEATPASVEEPEHPAPVLYVNEAPPADADQGISATTAAAATDASAGASGTSSALGLGFGIGGLGLGAIALVVALLAYTRGRRSAAVPAVKE